MIHRNRKTVRSDAKADEFLLTPLGCNLFRFLVTFFGQNILGRVNDDDFLLFLAFFSRVFVACFERGAPLVDKRLGICAWLGCQ